jgi:hypothetical protein
MRRSKFWTLNRRDYWRGFVVSVGSGALSVVLPILQTQGWPDLADWKRCALAAFTAGVSYLGLNFVTNSRGQIGKGE